MVLSAQEWRSGDSLPLLVRAMQQRTVRDADTALSSWSALARGKVLSTTVLANGDLRVERPVKLDQLTVEVYAESPNRSKQVIRSWRDTSYLPNMIRYHRDHLGIVANDFGNTIRLGDGDEVRNLIHPLSERGLAWYLFRMGAITTIQNKQGLITVQEVQVRPRDPNSAGTVGSLFLDVDRAALVRFSFTFTPAAYLDRTVQDITVVLDNALQDQAWWLPWRQSIIIRRADPRIELPSLSVIRADWELSDYQLGVTHPPGTFDGIPHSGPPTAPVPPSGAPPLAALPASQPEDLTAEEIQRAASDMLSGRSLSGLPSVRTALAGFSDLLSVNRAGGLIVSYGLRFPVGRSMVGRAKAGIAFGSSQLVGSATLTSSGPNAQWTLSASRQQEDMADYPATSSIRNSLLTSITGGDLGDWTLVEGLGISVKLPSERSAVTLELRQEWSHSLNTTFTPVNHEESPNPTLGIGAATVFRSRVSHQGETSTWALRAEAGTGNRDWLRLSGRTELHLGRWDISLQGGWGSAELPGYRSFALGGTGTLPGLGNRSLGGKRYALIEAGLRVPTGVPVPWSLVPLPRTMRRVTLPSTLIPFLAVGVAGGDQAGFPWRGTASLEPVVGLRLDLWGELLRVETGISLRHGGLGLSLDFHPSWWGAF